MTNYVSGVLPVVGLIASLWAVRISRQASRTSASVYAVELRREWTELRDDWAMSLLLYRGPDDYYVEASHEQREDVRASILSLPDPGSDITGHVSHLRSYTRNLRAVSHFMSHCADLILAGLLSTDDVYRILGPDVSRQGRALRWICGASDYEDTDGLLANWQIPDHSYFGQQEKIMLLMDVLWARTAYWGDNAPHSLMGAARHKRETGSGVMCRKRAYRLARRRGRPWLPAHRLSRSLRFAENPPVESVCRDGAIVEYIYEDLATRGKIPGLASYRGRRYVRRWKARLAATAN